MRTFTYVEACEYLNIIHGYIDVENDADYTEQEIIELAEAKWEDAPFMPDEVTDL